MNYETYSYLCLVSSVVVYLVALMAHAAEWASARKLDEPGRAGANWPPWVGAATRSPSSTAESVDQPGTARPDRRAGSRRSAGSAWR